MASIDEILLTDIKHQSDFVQKSGSGDLDTISGLNNVRDALFRRLITEPGTVIHRPNYGVGMKRFQNAPSSIATQRALALRIKDQFEMESRVESVLGIKIVASDSSPEKTLLIVRTKIMGYGETALQFTPFGEVS